MYNSQKELADVTVADGDDISEIFSAITLSFSPGHSLVHKPVFSEGVERPAEKNITNCFFFNCGNWACRIIAVKTEFRAVRWLALLQLVGLG